MKTKIYNMKRVKKFCTYWEGGEIKRYYISDPNEILIEQLGVRKKFPKWAASFFLDLSDNEFYFVDNEVIKKRKVLKICKKLKAFLQEF